MLKFAVANRSVPEWPQWPKMGPFPHKKKSQDLIFKFNQFLKSVLPMVFSHFNLYSYHFKYNAPSNLNLVNASEGGLFFLIHVNVIMARISKKIIKRQGGV